MAGPSVGLLHPGEMGSSVGAALVAGGARVQWASAGRSADTGRRATAAGLVAVEDLETLVGQVGGMVSVCPPDAAEALAREVGALGFRGIYVDANAVSPDTARRIESGLSGGGAGSDVDFVDGGIVGPPARRAGTTRLFLSGARAAEVAGWFAGSDLEALVIPGSAGSASALKMVYAAWTKGTTALLAAVYATAAAEGVEREILAEWEKSVPDVPVRLQRGVPASARKAWRFEAEMHEIAATFEAAGLPGGFHRAAAEVYARLAGFKDAEPPPALAEIAKRLRARSD